MKKSELVPHLNPKSWDIAEILLIICKWPVPQDDHLQEAGSSRWSFARGQILRMIICNNNNDNNIDIDNDISNDININEGDWGDGGVCECDLWVVMLKMLHV